MRKYPPREQLHPEVLTAPGTIGSSLLETLKQAGIRINTSAQACVVFEGLGGHDATHGPMFYAMLRWQQNKRPIYYLEQKLAETLTRTEVPMETFDLPIWLPDNGMFLALPPIFTVHNTQTGEHAVEGVYLVRDIAALEVDEEGKPIFHGQHVVEKDRAIIERGEKGYVEADCITCVGIGRPKGFLYGIREFRDDAVVTFHLVNGVPLSREIYGNFGGIPELTRVVTNLLYALQRTKSITTERAVPELSKKAKKRKPGKAEKDLDKDGRTLAPYTILRISDRVRPAEVRVEDTVEAGRKLSYKKFISGHFRKYWVVDPEGSYVHESRVNEQGTLLYCVEYLLAPFWQGNQLPEKTPKTVVIR